MTVRIDRGLPEVFGWQWGLSEVYQRYLDVSEDSLRSTRGSWMAVWIV